MICKGCKKEKDLIQESGLCTECMEQVQAYFKEANKSLEEYDFQKAIELLSNLLKLDEENVEAKDLKQDTEEKLKHLRESKAEADRCLQEGLYKEALFHIDEILKITPLDGHIRLQRQMTLLSTDTKPSSFSPELSNRTKMKPSDWLRLNYKIPSGWIAFVMVIMFLISLGFFAQHYYFEMAKKKAARDLYEKLQHSIEKEQYYGEKFLSEYEKLVEEYNDTEYAGKMKEEFYRISGKIIQRHIDTGHWYFEQGRYKKALEEYSKVLVIDPFHSLALSLIQRTKEEMLLTELSPDDKQKQMPEHDAEISEERPGFGKEISTEAKKHIDEAQQYFKEAKYDKAIDEWEKAEEFLDEEAKETSKALIEKAKDLRAKKEEDFNNIVEQGNRFSEAGNLKEALFNFEGALRINPDDINLLKKIKLIKDILKHSKSEVVVRREDDGEGKGRKNFFIAIKDFLAKKIKAKRELKAVIYYNRALDKEKERDFLKANVYYNKSLKCKPNPLIAKQIEINSIIMGVKAKMFLYPDDPLLGVSLASLYYTKGWLDDAENLWSEISEKNTDEITLQLLIDMLKAKVSDERGDFLEARERYESCLERAELFYVRNSLAKLLWKKGFYREAMEHWNAILEGHPYQLDVINSLSWTYVLFGNRWDELEELLSRIADMPPSKLREKQVYPTEVDPKYLVGTIKEKDYFSQEAFSLSRVYSFLAEVSEIIKWREVSAEVKDEKQ